MQKINFILICMVLFLSSCTRKMATVVHQDQTIINESTGNYRDGWNVLHYTLAVKPDIPKESLTGEVSIKLRVDKPEKYLRIDIFDSLTITAATFDGSSVNFQKAGKGFYYISIPAVPAGSVHSLVMEYKGKPRKAVLPPWDGGVQWTVDSLGRSWVQVACQGIGASTWWPCKDVQDDEPDEGADIFITVPDPLTGVSNGRLIDITPVDNGLSQWHWRVTQPINNYSITMDIGYYDSFHWVHKGAKGPLDCWAFLLDYHTNHLDTISSQINAMLDCFETKVAPYPFYEDSYKLVETAFLGMEHQSNIAYGNKFLPGYLGKDRSNTGVGLKFDFIIVHESGHEWFGNSITATSERYNWIHEGFTTYMETIFVECQQGKEAADQYVIGQRHIIKNDKPLVDLKAAEGNYTSDIYDKGSSMIHTLRMMMDDDAKFFAMLREMNRKFYHSIVDSKEIESFIQEYSKLNLQPFFQQYLYDTRIPLLHYNIEDDKLVYWFDNVVSGFSMPVAFFNSEGKRIIVNVTREKGSITLDHGFDHWDPNYYIQIKNAD